MAFSQLTAPLTHAAIKESADIYIAHNLPALPAAARAAQKYGALLGFDAEDFHSEELDPDLYPLEGKLCAAIEAAYLPQCHHLTAAAPLIAQAYRQRYGVEMTTLLNVFPLSEAPSMPMPARAGASVLYWFSQTIGPDRGLEAMLSVLAVMRTPAELHLRGTPLPGYRDTLAALAEKLGVGTRLRFLPPAPPAEMAMIAASCTLGLSLEQDHPQNRAICLTNKVFTYLLAGIPILLSRTPAHIELAQALGNAALLVAPTGPGEAAAQIDLLLGDAELLAKARAKAWQLGHERFNWDFEQKVFLARIDALFRDAKN